MIPVMLLIKCSSVFLLKTNGYVGLNSIKSVFQYPLIYPDFAKIQKNKTEIVFHLRQMLPFVRETVSLLLKILHSYLKEFSPKPSSGTVSVLLCCSVSSPFCPAQAASLNSDWHHSQLSKGCGLTNSVMFFALKLTNVYDNANELSSVQKCAFQIPQGSFFVYWFIFDFHFSRVLLILVTVRCTYWGPLWWGDSVILNVGKTILFIFFWICCCHSDDQKDTCDVHLSLCPAPVV